MGTWRWYGNGLLNVARGNVDLDTDTINCSLHTSAYVPDQDAHDFFNDATNELATAGGYTAGGQALTAKALTYDAATNEVRWDFADPSWSSATFTARVAVLSKRRGGASSADELIAYNVFVGDETIAGGTFSLTIDATGALKLTAAA